MTVAIDLCGCMSGDAKSSSLNQTPSDWQHGVIEALAILVLGFECGRFDADELGVPFADGVAATR